MQLVIPRRSIVGAIGLLVLLGLGNLLGQTSTARRYTVVEGVVSDAKSRTTIPNAQIMLFADTGTSQSTVSDDQGRFTFPAVPLGRYGVQITRPGFVPYGSVSTPIMVSLESDQLAKNLRFELTPLSVFLGRVTNEDGVPQVGVRVAAVRPDYEDGKRMLSFCTTPSQGTTDDKGNYRLHGLEPGRYFIVFYSSGCNAVPQFYPGVTDLDDAIPVAIAGGTTPLADTRLRREKTYSTRFQAVDPPLSFHMTGSFPAAARVVMNGGSSDLHVRVLDLSYLTPIFRKGPDNRYEIAGLPRGHYTVYYGAEILFGNVARFNIDIVDRDVDAGIIVPTEMVRGLNGRISGPSRLLAGLRVRLHAADGPWPSTHFRSNFSSTVIVPAATFTFGNLPGQRYFIEVTGLPPDAYLASARYGGQDVLGRGISLDGKPSGPLDLEVKESGGIVEGIVSDVRGKPLQQGIVALIPTSDRRTNPLLFRASTISKDGNYSIRGALPGEYEILAWESVEPGAWMNERYLQPFSTRTVRVTVREGLPSRVEIKGISDEIRQLQ